MGCGTSGRIRGRIGVGALALAAFAIMATGASALSLADLVAGETLATSNGLTFSNFAVKVKGGLTKSLDDYAVVETSNGFQIYGDVARGAGGNAGRGKIKLSYDVAGGRSALVAGMLGVQPGGGDVRVSALKKLYDGKKKLGTLEVSSLGALRDELELSGVTNLRVRERIRLKDGFGGGHVSSSFATVPEPSTFALLGLGLASVAARRRRARRAR